MLNRVKKTINTYQMIKNGKPIIVGVSGGPDSMVLLDILAKLVPNKLVVAHLNHQFRGKDAEEDANFVKQQAELRGIDVALESYDVPKYMKETGLGSQEAARKIRYEFYQKIAQKYDAKYIALGHHATDQAETVLMRILRGTGAHGLAGIPYIRDFGDYNIIRPLLDITRDEIEFYCNDNKIEYRTDQSNFSTKYFRNQIRLEVIPYLKEYNPRIEQHLFQMAKVLQDEDQFLNKMAHSFLNENLIKSEEKYKLTVFSLQKLDIALQRRVIHLILTYLNSKGEYTSKHIEQIIYLINQKHPSKSLDIPGIKVFRNYEELVFSTEIINIIKESYTYNISIPGEIEIPILNKKIRTFVLDYHEKRKGIWAVFDYGLIKNNQLVVRSRKNGDRIEPIGLNGKKKLKELFIDLKIPKGDRNFVPIVEDGNRILWIPGIKRSKHAIITPQTKEFLYVIMD